MQLSADGKLRGTHPKLKDTKTFQIQICQRKMFVCWLQTFVAVRVPGKYQVNQDKLKLFSR